MSLRVLHVIPSFWPATRYGGPIEGVLRLCQRLLGLGVTVEVVTTDADGAGDLAVPHAEKTLAEGVPVRYFPRRPRTRFAVSAPLALHLAREIPRWDLVHVTALFSFSSAATMALARRAGVPAVLSPQGTLMPWAIGSKRWKKAPYFELVERKNVLSAAGVHATSDEEAREILHHVPGARTFVVPNGVDVPDVLPDVPREKARIVFLGRIHPVKGFDVLVPALARVAAILPEVETLVAGPDEDGEQARVEALLARVTPRPRVRFLGPVYGKEKQELLASATVLVLPSHGENFGIVVAEALAAGTPVVVSKACPWKILEERGAGAWVENTPERIAEALLLILEDPARARRMGEAGRAVAAGYGWDAIAKQMLTQYEALALRRRRP
ncbi:glycosyltransferase [Polyangium sorediatum]|uniref:Glycosyltransferase n=1 Tax=Polyangium sorediatum TaxID=889274 RepID=A0ABT6NXU3_9BACT|nr:glycosyltransferase [Polyangium sorediatum]MDI1433169.1 glycosyltransferase [Polyangium sorediatum]